MAKSKQNMKKNNNKTIKRYRRKVKNKRKKTKRRQTKRKQTTKKLLKGGKEVLFTFQNIYKNIEKYKYLKLQNKEGPPLREWLVFDKGVYVRAHVDGDRLFISHFVETLKTPTHIKWNYGSDYLIPDQNTENITTDDDYTCKNDQGNIFNLKDYDVTIEDDKAIIRTLKKSWETQEEERLLITFQDILDDTEKYGYVKEPYPDIWTKIKKTGARNLTFYPIQRDHSGPNTGNLFIVEDEIYSCQIPEDIGDKQHCDCGEYSPHLDFIIEQEQETNQDLRYEINECVRRAAQTQGE